MAQDYDAYSWGSIALGAVIEVRKRFMLFTTVKPWRRMWIEIGTHMVYAGISDLPTDMAAWIDSTRDNSYVRRGVMYIKDGQLMVHVIHTGPSDYSMARETVEPI